MIAIVLAALGCLVLGSLELWFLWWLTDDRHTIKAQHKSKLENFLEDQRERSHIAAKDTEGRRRARSLPEQDSRGPVLSGDSRSDWVLQAVLASLGSEDAGQGEDRDSQPTRPPPTSEGSWSSDSSSNISYTSYEDPRQNRRGEP